MKTLILAIVMALSISAHAEVTATPGSVWNYLGTTPAERGNVIDYFHVDQGIVVGHVGTFEVTPYVAVNATKDTKDYSWDNRQEYEGGVKFVKFYNSGAINLGIAYGHESRNDSPNPSESRSALMVFTNGWFGYNAYDNPEEKHRFLGAPGSFAYTVGNVSPFERNDILAVARLEQGLTFAKVGNMAVNLQYWGQVSADTKGYDWNNRLINGVGLRGSLPFGKNATLQITAGYECDQSLFNNCGPIISLNLWDGWRNDKGGNK